MKLLLADENVDYRIVKSLRINSYEIGSILDTHRGISDNEVINLANEIDAIILTEDKDFGDLTFRLKIDNKGIILLRLSGLNADDKLKILLKVLSDYGDKLYKKFTVITVGKVRIKNT